MRLGTPLTGTRVRKYRAWMRSLGAPRARLLPGLGARMAAHPRLAAWLLVSVRKLPAGRMRAAAYRNVSRPFTTRMRARLEVPVSGGSRMLVDTSEAMGRTLAISGVWEPHVTPVFRSLLAPGDLCLDVGASIGYYTLLASRLVGPDGHVYAFEPAPRIYAVLCANLELNDVANVTALCVAAGAEDGRAPLYDPPPGNLGQSSMRVRSERSGPQDHGLKSAMEVPVRPAVALLPSSELRRVRLVKIDVEGYEVDVLRGLEPLFEGGGRPSMLVELHPQLWVDGDAASLLSLCRRYALRPFELVDEDSLGHSLPDPIRIPLELATLGERQEVIRALLLFGESLDAKTSSGSAPEGAVGAIEQETYSGPA